MSPEIVSTVSFVVVEVISTSKKNRRFRIPRNPPPVPSTTFASAKRGFHFLGLESFDVRKFLRYSFGRVEKGIFLWKKNHRINSLFRETNSLRAMEIGGSSSGMFIRTFRQGLFSEKQLFRTSLYSVGTCKKKGCVSIRTIEVMLFP